jgi:carboxypeptidase C (cathepsin A)
MRKLFLFLALPIGFSATGNAQQRPQGQPAQAPPAQGQQSQTSTRRSATSNSTLNLDSVVVTKHQVTIKGQTIPYTATTGSIPVWDEEGHPIAGVFFTYYERDDVKDRAPRPLLISFNGGPGTSSIWMEMGYTGPRLVNVDDEGYPLQPYGFKENNHSLLDDVDIIYLDPVNTGYSRMVNQNDKGIFFGVNQDVKYLAAWINTFVTRYNRWASPKFIIGESYGTTRASGLALELQNAQWMFLNGVILVSPTTLGIDREGPAGAALKVPYMAATAWYHKQLVPEYQQKSLVAYLPEVEDFTMNQLLPAIAKGGSLSDAERKVVAAKLAKYIGISEKTVLGNNLDISTSLFWKELLRDEGFTVGRLDSRYKGIDKQSGGERSDFNPEIISWEHSFTPAMNMYLRNELNYKTDLKYYVFGPVRPWDNSNNNVGNNLGLAMRENPYLHLLVQSGYYDGACDYFNAKYNMWQIDPSGKLKDRMKWEGYESGHMMYLRKPDLANATESLRKFIKDATPKPGQPAKY